MSNLICVSLKFHFADFPVVSIWNIQHRDEHIMTDVATDVSEHTFILTVIY